MFIFFPMRIFFVLVSLLFSFLAFAQKTIIIDPGHQASKDPGAAGARGLSESYYCDKLVTEIEKELKKDSNYKVVLTRQPGQPFSQKDIDKQSEKQCGFKLSGNPKWRKNQLRSCISNWSKGDLFISIHHDTPTEEYLNVTKKNGKVYSSINQKYIGDGLKSGYIIFVPDQNKVSSQKAQKSLDFARILSRNFISELGRTPSTFHQMSDLSNAKSTRRGYKLLDEHEGLFSASLIADLMRPNMPAIVVEVGVISDEKELEIIDTDEFRKKFAIVLKQSIDTFFNF